MLVQHERQGLGNVAGKVDKERVDGHPVVLRAEPLLERVDRARKELPEVGQHLHLVDR